MNEVPKSCIRSDGLVVTDQEGYKAFARMCLITKGSQTVYMSTFRHTRYRYQMYKQASPSLPPLLNMQVSGPLAILLISPRSMQTRLGNSKQRSLDLFQPLPSLIPFFSHRSNFPLFNRQRHL